MNTTQTIQKYPTRLHEDWRYFTLTAEEYEALLSDTVMIPLPSIPPEPGVRLLHGKDAVEPMLPASAPTVPDDVFTGQTDAVPLTQIEVEKTIERTQLIHLETADAGTAAIGNVYLQVHPGVRAEVLFRMDTPSARSYLNSRLRIIVHPGASLTCGILGSGHADSFTMVRIQAVVAKNAGLHLFSLQTGSGRTRTELSTTLTGTESTLTVNQAVLAGGQAVNDTVVKMVHAAAHSRSDMNTLTYAGGASRSILNGLIQVRPEASFVEAYQQARNYILSDRAYCVGYPQLEIENPDVACSHGTTMHTFDDNQLYYLGTRGIDRAQARKLILKGHLDYFFRGLNETTRERVINHGYATIDALIS